jgi:hypothetical protein
MTCGTMPAMLFNINISAVVPNSPNFSVQVDAPDLVAALEAAKEPMLKSAAASASVLLAALPAESRPAAPVSPTA